MARVYRRRGAAELRQQFNGRTSSTRRLCGQNSPRREASRPAGHAGGESRTGHQSQDSRSPWHLVPTDVAWPRRRGDRMRRREFIAALGGAAAWPLAARAQQPPMPVIGYLSLSSPVGATYLDGLRQGLNETGYIEGQNVAIEYRWAEGHYDRYPALVAELVGRQVNVILAAGTVQSALVAKAATATIPIVFANGSDPIKFGLVASLNRPGGNLTGVSFFTAILEAKRLELLHELVPSAATIACLVNPNNPNAETQLKDIDQGARALRLRIKILNASSERDFDKVFEALDQQQTGALLIASDLAFLARRQQITALVARHAVPAIYEWREFVEAGGLASYGTSLTEAYRQAGVYVGKILKGAKPAELPVIQSTKFEFVINLKTAKTLGLDYQPAPTRRSSEVER